MTRSLLVIEDDPVNQEVLRRFLGGRGFKVTTAASAEEGLKLLGEESFAAILLDNVLPGITGMQAIQEIAAKTPAPILVMTGHADEELRKDALLLGARSFLYKPFDFELLLKAIEQALA